MKVLEMLESPEGYPGWNALRVEGEPAPILVNKNWFGARQELGLPDLKVGDEVAYNIRADVYSSASEYKYVQNFHMVEEGEV
jgi:hypothetical protein